MQTPGDPARQGYKRARPWFDYRSRPVEPERHSPRDVGTVVDADASTSRLRGATSTHVGRYWLVRELGRGAMGVVYLAHDPDLDRELAVKLIVHRRHARASDSALAWDRLGANATVASLLTGGDEQLLAEARALAKVAHPNIVEVYDVGATSGGIFIAMAYVAGESLRRWSQTRTRAWSETLQVCIAAGEALAAAHAVGIVHGDFKPDNVLVGVDGRSRVVDFGLSRAIAGAAAVTAERDTADDPAAELVGSPAYLAPECWSTTQREPSADQFAFFVALAELLLGRRPFAGGGSLVGLLRSMQRGFDASELRARVPHELVRVVARGLSVDPRRRYPSMRAALDALAAVPARRRRRTRRRRTLAIASGTIAALLAGLATRQLVHEQRHGAHVLECERARDAMTATWSDAIAAELSPSAATSLALARPWLDGHVAQWQEGRMQACLRAATGEPPEALDTLRSGCYADDLARVSGLVEVLGDPDPLVAGRAVLAAADLPSPARCDDDAWLAIVRPRANDPAVATTVRAVERGLGLVEIVADAGRFDEARTRLAAVSLEARAVAWPSLDAAVALTKGRLEVDEGELERAEATLEGAYFAATEAADDELAAAAALALAELVGQRMARFDAGDAWLRHADLAITHAGLGEGELRARALLVSAAIASRRGALEQAELDAAAALALRERLLGDRHPAVAAAVQVLGSIAGRRDRPAQARAAFDRAHGILRATLGSDHLDVAAALHGRGMAALSMHDVAAARSDLADSLRIRERVLGPEHPELATSLSGLGYVELAQGQLDAAQSDFERALAIRERALGADHPAVADTLGNLAQVAERRGDCQAGVAALTRALDVVERSAASDRRARVRFLVHLGEAHHVCARPDLARAALHDARDLLRDDDPPSLRAAIERGLAP